ncbi:MULTISPECIES: DedA family protein [Microbacterium]|nr:MULTISPECIES: VTT domain-containing protein [Microbacterium]
MPTDLFADALASPWSLVVMSLLVLGDAFVVVIPGEIAVTALGALAVATGSPPLWAVVLCAAAAAAVGDACCYLIGRLVGTRRWRWMRAPRVRQALDGARRRLDRGAATVLFTARFVPFARLAVNLVAGASHVRPLRYFPLVVVAATGWAVYQAAVGALIAAVLPGGPLVAVPVSIVVAVALGLAVDRVAARRRGRLPARDDGALGSGA